MDIPYEKQFHFHDGTAVASLEQLRSKIESLSYQEFYRHVNAQKNDFSAWIRHVLHEERLADDLLKVTSIVETVEILNDYLHPRPVVTPRTDTQSKIEQSIFSTPLQVETNDHLNVESVPTTAPVIATKTGKEEALDFKIIEESIDMPQAHPNQNLSQDLFAQSSRQDPPPPLPLHEDSHLIVKDFMYGLLFGLIIGLILGRILSF